MRLCEILCGLLLWGCLSLFGQSVSIHGHNLGYIDKTIQISRDLNPYITIPNSVKNVMFDSDGRFEYSLEVETSTSIQFHIGVYRANLYIEPEISYEVELPEYREKTYADRISPFFQPIDIPLKVLSRSPMDTTLNIDAAPEINYLIARFDSLFYRANEEVIMNRRLGRESDVDFIVSNIESEFLFDSSLFVNEYKKYKYGVMRLNEGKTGLEKISQNFLGPVIRDSHPGFMELFRAMFKDFIFYYSRSPRGKGLVGHINRSHNIDSVRSTIRKHPAIWNDTLAEMVLLQELSGLFYSGNIHKESILILLDSMVLNPVSKESAIYASQLNSKLSSLVIGYPPPQFELQDLAGNIRTPGDFQGKYVYLMFCTPDHYGCMMEYPFLQSFHQKHSAYLEVITVMVAEEEKQVKDFMIRNGYGWQALFYKGQPGILSDYLVKAFPTAYLIDPEGNLVLSPSSLPSDGFEQQLFRIMRSKGEI